MTEPQIPTEPTGIGRPAGRPYGVFIWALACLALGTAKTDQRFLLFHLLIAALALAAVTLWWQAQSRRCAHRSLVPRVPGYLLLGLGMFGLAVAPGGLLRGQPEVTAIFLVFAVVGIALGRVLVLGGRAPRV
jgi:hypothetical protein